MLSLGSGISVNKSQVGLDQLDNVQQLPLNYLDIDTSLTSNSDVKVPSQKAIRAYIDGHVTTLNASISTVSTNLTSHTSDIAKHREINDSGTLSTDLWSAQKISSEIDNVSSNLSGRLLAPVGDIAGLKAIDTSSLTDKILINVETKGLYRFDLESTDTGDDDRIVTPTVGSGRWIKMNASINDHNNLNNIQGGAVGEYNHITNDFLAALAGASGTPSSSNKYLTAEKVTMNAHDDISGFNPVNCKLDMVKVVGHASLDDGIYVSDGSNWLPLIVCN